MAFISIITDESNKLTKHFKLGDDGKLLKSAPGHLTKGSIEAIDVTAAQLVDTIKNLDQNQCLCLGVLDSPDKQDILCGKMAKKGQPTRSKEYLSFFPDNSFLLLDFDDSGKTPEEAIDCLSNIDPQFKSCGMAVIPSSSSYIYTDSGEEIVGEGNYHIFVELQGDKDPFEYGNLLFDRLILQGFCKPVITKAGAIIIKSMFDKVVLSPEREIFSANPTCESPLVTKRLDYAFSKEGPAIDTSLISPISEDEKMELRLMLKEIREDLHEESLKVREQYYIGRAKERAKEKGTHYLRELPNIVETHIFYDKQGRPVMELLSSEHIMNEQGELFPVRDLLLNPTEGMKLPDPLEPYKRGDESRGIPGKGVATVLGPIIYSHNHCGMIHLMKWTASDVIDVMNEGTQEDKVFLWKALSSGTQELSSTTTEAEQSEIADVVKEALGKVKEARVGKEKRHIISKLKISGIPDVAEVDSVLEMNAKYGVVNMAGKVIIVSEHWNSAAEEFEIVYTHPAGLDTLTKNITMRLPTTGQHVSLYKYWEQHPERRTFDEIVFEPNAHTFRTPGKVRAMPNSKKYNMFQGYMYEPSKATSCDLILNHIKEVWCSDNIDEYNYAIGWLAHLFQHPEQLSQTALVLQSVPGAGKGMIIENCISKTFGIHAMSTARSDDLVGRFNSHLGVNLFFYANEMEYTAQHSVKSLLKTIVETETRTIEAKNVNKIKAKNYSSLIFTANEGWVLNIDHGDRRYVYLSVSSKRVGDKAYFTALKKQIDNGGREAFVKFLLAYDLDQYDYMKFPDKKHHQRVADFLRSANPVVRFVWSLYDTDFGVAHFANDPSYKSLREWQDGGKVELELSKAQFFSLYREYCEYYRIERKYDDMGSISMYLETGGLLKRPTDPRDEYVIERRQKGKKEIFALKSVEDGKPLLKV